MILRTGTDEARRRRPHAFTLVELLVVMGIIGVLVALLLPAVNRAVIAVRRANCAARISAIQTGLDAFKGDWGIYPPSDANDSGLTFSSSWVDDGYEVLALCLMGPEGRGWGRVLGSEQEYMTPFGAKSESKTYGPYFQMELMSPSSGIPDAFPSPRRPVLYFVFDLAEMKYHYDHNPTGDIEEGFYNENHFELSAQFKAPDGQDRWHRKDYLLVSAGADRLYGYVRDEDPPTYASSTSQIQSGDAICDDITNFK